MLWCAVVFAKPYPRQGCFASSHRATSSRNKNRKKGLARGLLVDGTTHYHETRSETLSVPYEQAFAECLDHQTQEQSPGQDPYFLIHGFVYDGHEMRQLSERVHNCM